jgi:hypothetical protein
VHIIIITTITPSSTFTITQHEDTIRACRLLTLRPRPPWTSSSPARSNASRLIVASTPAACSPPMTAMREFGQAKRPSCLS